MNTIKISEESLQSFSHDKNVMGNEQAESRQVVKIIVKEGKFGLPIFMSGDKIVGEVFEDSYHEGKYRGRASFFACIDNSTLPEVLDYLMSVIEGNLRSTWGLYADFQVEN